MKNEKPVAIVTGGSSGIGKAVCSALFEEGYLVINADIQAPAENEKNEDAAIFFQCDVTRSEDVENLSRFIQEKGEVKALVLNAGRGVHEKIKEGDPEKWYQVINLNICGTLRILRAVLPFMNEGHVFFISSVSASSPHPYGAVYAATKSALDTIAETLRQEELPHIKVTTISPGVVDTPFFDNMLAGSHSIDSIGWGAVKPEEIADSLVYILNQKKDTVINTIVIRPSAQVL